MGFFWFLVFCFCCFLSFFLLQIFKHERDQKRKDVSVKLNYNSIRRSAIKRSELEGVWGQGRERPTSDSGASR